MSLAAARPRAQHGTRSKYQAGCRCDDCRRANREHNRSLKGKEPPRHGTQSGYSNYGCRCDACREAHRQYQWLRPEYQHRYSERLRGTEPPRHGYSHAYNTYGCRCDECRAWASSAYRRRKAREVA